jgi:hypothetical protein
MTASQKLRRLVTLDVAKTVDGFLDLPLPENSSLVGATPKALFQIANNFYRSWLYLISARDLFLGGEATVPNTGKKLSREKLWCRLFFIVGAYYDFSIRLLLRSRGAGTHIPPPGLRSNSAKEFVTELNVEDLELLQQELDLVTEGSLPLEEANQRIAKLLTRFKVTSIEELIDAVLWSNYRNSAGYLAGNYIAAMTASLWGELLRHTNIPLELIEDSDGISHRTAAELYTVPKMGGWPPELIKLSERLLATIFEQWVRIYDRPDWDKAHRLGPFSSMRLRELAPLANRDAHMIKKYGTKQIEKVFEQQLALIVQSFGLYVISTRTGERTVDLICISADPTAHFTFLLEAKTSGRPYSLPRDDARALLEYISEVQAGLTTLPPLRFVLMIGPAPSSTLEKKLQTLEAEAGLPIRFCTAREIAQLREVVAGPIPLRDFTEYLLLAPKVVPTGFAQAMRSRADQLRSSHEALVRTMLSSVY